MRRIASGLCPECTPDEWARYAAASPLPHGVDSARLASDRTYEVVLDGHALVTATRAEAGEDGWALCALVVDDLHERRFLHRGAVDARRVATCRIHGRIRYDVFAGRVEIRPAAGR
jgi:hypothetical protein